MRTEKQTSSVCLHPHRSSRTTTDNSSPTADNSSHRACGERWWELQDCEKLKQEKLEKVMLQIFNVKQSTDDGQSSGQLSMRIPDLSQSDSNFELIMTTLRIDSWHFVLKLIHIFHIIFYWTTILLLLLDVQFASWYHAVSRLVMVNDYVDCYMEIFSV